MRNEAKKELIWLYGAKCMLTDMKIELNYHHLQKKCDGGKETVENGAIISRRPHTWLHSLEDSDMGLYREINEALKFYKMCLDFKESTGLKYFEELKREVKNRVR